MRATSRIVLMWSSLLFVVVTLSVGAPVSLARVYAPYPSGGGLVENPDGTWSFYGEGDTTKPLKVFSSAEYDALGREAAGVSVDAGTTGEAPSVVTGIKTPEEEAVKRVFERLHTNELYKDTAERLVGEDFVTEMEAEATIPTEESVIASAATTAGPIVLAVGGGLALGVAIDAGVEMLFGIPTLRSPAPKVEPGCKTVFQSDCEWEVEWDTKVRLNRPVKCTELSVPSFIHLPGGTRKCGTAEVKYHFRYAYEEEKKVKGEDSDVGPFVGHGECTGTGCIPGKELFCGPFGGIVHCESEETETEKTIYNYWIVPTRPEVKELAFPGKVGELGNVPHPSPEISPMSPVGPLTAPPAKELPKKVPPLIIHIEEPGTLPGIHDPGEVPVPDPLLPEIPVPEHDELYTHYQSRIEAEGFTDVKENVLPETAIDTTVGPDDVTAVDPAGGSRVAPDTKITVDVNPPDAPIPGEPTTKVGAPTLPGFKLPDLGVLCKGFPFGVPCWLIETVEGWSATPVAPEWGIGGWEVEGHKIPDTKFKLSVLEPVMEKVRVAMLIFATIGVVLLFYRFAKGGSPESGGGKDVVNSSATPDEDVYL